MIRLDNVRAGYRTASGFVAAVDGVSLTVQDSEILGIAGESGCGKSTLLKILYGQLGDGLSLESGTLEATFPDPVTGKSRTYRADELRQLWWKQLSYVPQGSMSVMNPVTRIHAQMVEALPVAMLRRGRKALRAELEAFLAELKLPASVLDAYPHQLSGGMRQRVMIAMASFFQPRLMLADEPTTALDVVVQKNILLLLVALQRRQRNTLVIVSHDLGVHYQVTDRIVIAYAGRIVEVGPTREVFASPAHPYTRALIDALPRIGDRSLRHGIEGRPPDLSQPPPGCRFAPRCPQAQDVCRHDVPQLEPLATAHSVACHFPLRTSNVPASLECVT
jgi:peptide/nickel transport system ATP-binding protein